MQWTGNANAGFTTGAPWLKVNENKTLINVEVAEKNANSTLNYFKKMVKLRKSFKDILVYGKYTLLDKNNPEVYAYTREAEGQKVLVLLNFRKNNATFNLNGFQLGDELINNMQKLNVNNGVVSLTPYQAVIIKIKN